MMLRTEENDIVTLLFSIGYNSNETQIENCWKTKQTNQ